MTLDLALILLAAAVGGYLLGSVPFGLVLTRLVGIDLRAIGSGNIGATNVLRTGRKGLAAATLLLDSGKGAIAAALAWGLVDNTAGLVAGVCAVIGHNFPVWLKFKGGKGVATTLGVLAVTAWPVGLAACLTWVVVAALFRYSSLAALVALTLAPVYAGIWASSVHGLAFALLAVLAIFRHRDNIKRLINGEESRIQVRRKRDP